VSKAAKSILRELEAILADQSIVPCRDLDPHLRDQIIQAISPDASPEGVVYPKNQAELATVVSYAHKHQWRILPWGGGSKLAWGGLPAVDLMICTQQLNQVIDHAVGDLTITVEAGMPFTELQRQLKQAGQWWAVDPAYPNRATVGGIVATADTGSLRHRYGGVRDMCLGLSLIRADGQVAKAGGRVVKNVAGYDLMKLLTGSFGTLGVLAEVTLRLYPLPPAAQTVVLAGPAVAVAETVASLLNSTLTPTALDVLSAQMLSPFALKGSLGLCIQFQALPESVDQQVSRTLEVAAALGLSAVTLDEAGAVASLDRLWQEQATVTAKLGVLPAQAAPALSQMEALATQHQVSLRGRIHASSGLGMVRLTGDNSALMPVVLALRSLCAQHQGFLSLLEAPLPLKQQLDVWGYSGNALGLMQAIKRQFDPHQLLSPGRFVGGI
jgi:glycolate oxidase FAD binding subunit